MYAMKFRWPTKTCLFSMLAVAVILFMVAWVVPTFAATNDSSSQPTQENSSKDKQSTKVEVEQPVDSENGEPGKLPETPAASDANNPQNISTLMIVPPEDKSPSTSEPAKKSTTKSNPIEQPVAAEKPITPKSPKSDSAGNTLKPIPEQKLTGPPAIEVASFKGITPGVTTAEQLEETWGAPQELRSVGQHKILLFSVGPFKQVEVALSGKVVSSIVIQLENPFPPGAVIKQLQLSNVRPVFISNELGDVLGQAFPERGVMFAFVQNHEPGRPSMKVDKIVLEPIDAEAFVLRAETNLDSHYQRTLDDVDAAIKLMPQNPKAHWLRSRVLTALEKIDESIAAAEKAVQLDPDNPQYRITLSRILAQAGKFEKAVSHAEV
ncbi:MAG: hypothetical protein JXM70_27720, partial [Pirellulales bacterium]|nr:hypothetical protein [Pirellulales bacterium]